MMFSKGTWTLFKLKQVDGEPAPLDTFTAAFGEAGTRYIPLVAISKAIHEQTRTVGLAPFSTPRLGDDEDIEFYFEQPDKAEKDFKVEDMSSFLTNYDSLFEWGMEAEELVNGTMRVPLAPLWKPNLTDWQFTPGVFGAWFMAFEYIDALDANSKKEQLAYGYGAPFKLQSGEIRKQIQDQIVSANTFTRKHHQVILDFNQGYVWLNSGSKPVVEEALALFEELGLAVATPEDLIGDIDQDAISATLNKLYTDSLIQGEVVRRLEEAKLHGPAGVEPNPNAVMEKILKAYCAFSEAEGFHIGMSTPLSMYLSPSFLTTTGTKTVYETSELLLSHEEATISEAGLTFCYYTDKITKSGEVRKILEKRFSIQASPNIYFTELPGLIIRGLNVENYKSIVKTHTKATGSAPTIAEFWSMYYDAMKVHVFTYFSVLKDVVAAVEV